jgi:hypothetical protein
MSGKGLKDVGAVARAPSKSRSTRIGAKGVQPTAVCHGHCRSCDGAVPCKVPAASMRIRRPTCAVEHRRLTDALCTLFTGRLGVFVRGISCLKQSARHRIPTSMGPYSLVQRSSLRKYRSRPKCLGTRVTDAYRYVLRSVGLRTVAVHARWLLDDDQSASEQQHGNMVPGPALPCYATPVEWVRCWSSNRA